MRVIAAIGLIVTVAHADISGTDAHGVYLHTDNGYVAAQQLDSFNRLNFDASVAMMSLPALQRSGDKLQVLVHHPDFHPSFFEMDARPVQFTAAPNPLDHTVTPLGDNRYKITVNKPINDGHVVLVNLDCCFASIHGAMLGDPIEAIKAAFAKGSDQNPASAEHTLNRISSAMPDNAEIADLRSYWEIRLAQRDATREFEFVESIWTRFENTEGSDSRIDALRHFKSVAEAYLNKHPQGLEKDQVQSMLKQAEERLNI